MNKKQIKLTENDLKQIVKESVKKILFEGFHNGEFWGDDNHGENPEEYADFEDEEMYGPDEINKDNKDRIIEALFDASKALSEAKQKLFDADSCAGRGAYRDRFYKIHLNLSKIIKEFSKLNQDIHNELK